MTRPTVKERRSKHTTTTAHYSIFAADGESYLQIDTVGSATRQEKEKISQSILLDARAMRELRTILDRALQAR